MEAEKTITSEGSGIVTIEIDQDRGLVWPLYNSGAYWRAPVWVKWYDEGMKTPPPPVLEVKLESKVDPQLPLREDPGSGRAFYGARLVALGRVAQACKLQAEQAERRASELEGELQECQLKLESMRQQLESEQQRWLQVRRQRSAQ